VKEERGGFYYMEVTPEQTAKILTGGHKFSQLAFSMMVTRLISEYKSDSSAATLQHCANEINVFIRKFERIMAADISLINQL
jgi:hypothetical protein